MKRNIKILLMVMIMLMTTISSFKTADAASGSVGMSASASTVTVGNTVTVTVSANCEGGFVAQMALYYNSSYLKLISYPSGDFNPGNGSMLIDTQGSSGSLTFKFETIAVGSTTVSLSVIDFISYSDDSVTGYSNSLSRTITINQKSSGGGGGSGGGTTPTPTPTPVTPTLSSDASLSSISIEGIELEPAFSSKVTEYKVYLPKDVTSLNIKAAATNSKAKVASIDGTVKQGWNTIPIVCTAEDGTKKTYNIQVYVEEEPTVIYQYNEKNYGVVKNLDKLVVEEGFEPSDLEIKNEEAGIDEKITVYTWNGYDLLYVENEEGEKSFYQYDKVNNVISNRFDVVDMAEKKFVAVDFKYEDLPVLNDTLQQEDIKLNEEVSVKGWGYKDQNLQDFKILYLGNDKGEYALYKYDFKENTIQRYIEPVVEEVENPLLKYLYGTSAGAGVMALLALLLAIKNGNLKKKLNSN